MGYVKFQELKSGGRLIQSQTFSKRTEELELEILHGGKKLIYEEAFRSLHDISKKQPPKGVQDKIIDYMLRLIVIDRWTWVQDLEESQSRRNKSILNRSSAIQVCQTMIRRAGTHRNSGKLPHRFYKGTHGEFSNDGGTL